MAPQLAERIITSHKEAAKRATTYLQDTRNLKLKPTEALDLVARVLGAANWQTLLGLAQQGQVPRRGHFPPVPAEQGLQSNQVDALDDTRISSDTSKGDADDIRRLAKYYAREGDPGEHPRLTRQAWQAAESERAYWEWVFYEVICDCGLLPWDADEMESYQLARAAGVTVERTENGRWLARAPAGLYIEVYYAANEAWAWKDASEAVHIAGINLVGARWPRMPFAEKLATIKRRFSSE